MRATAGAQRFVLPSMATIVEVIVVTPRLDGLVEETAGLLVHHESLLSRFQPDSDVSALNRAAGGVVEVAEATSVVLDAALTLAGLSDGAFTPCIGALSELWNVKGWLAGLAAGRPVQPPGQDVLDAARRRCAPGLLEKVDERAYRLHGGARLDLGAIAKGFVADAVRGLCLDRGVEAALVSVGASSIAAAGTRPDGRPWRVGVNTPTGEAILGSVELADGADLATSGDQLQQLPGLVDGQLVHHVVDPATGRPSDAGVRQATAVCADGMRAEVAATALMMRSAGRLAGLLDGVEYLTVTDEAARPSPGLPWLPADG
ncbi:FAD:protein FMN transferase [Propionibacterium australiense]|uniref:FAD:protein FMN transferase n=1 Tax=Propionibacterium australiense TaxID=119981 RepID=A0A383S5H3_9ACTN|nr:FAD:protein FMN transferase [Propionibacterium australiense]RLP11919.1 FAD:protein FMN transferase [Propionibacterium australiense]RLP12557.1 FAD:protein FMN transferase [Propionibacterium australiense]SYZ32619.1 Flavin transferase ApbE [Propionibacterium australiense]VEH91630.1 Thiamine biosynthesis lipoprotein ApbE precursor [Propionibacterium australiense]